MPGFDAGSTPPALGAFGRLARRLRSRRLVVQDRSMEPEFRPGDRLLLDPAAYRSNDPAYGDVVVVEDPFDMERFLLKRVAGLPGDYIRVTANGAERRTGPPSEGAPPGALEEFHIPPSQVPLSSPTGPTGPATAASSAPWPARGSSGGSGSGPSPRTGSGSSGPYRPRSRGETLNRCGIPTHRWPPPP